LFYQSYQFPLLQRSRETVNFHESGKAAHRCPSAPGSMMSLLFRPARGRPATECSKWQQEPAQVLHNEESV
jgi:hypothetical protein